MKSFEIIHLLNEYLHSNYNNKESPSGTEDPILDNKDKAFHSSSICILLNNKEFSQDEYCISQGFLEEQSL